MKRLYTVLLLLLFVAEASAQNTPQTAYTVYNTTTKNKVSLTDVAQAMNNANIVFYGELHDDSVGHIAEFDLLKALSTQYSGKLALSMEMFETDVQPVLI